VAAAICALGIQQKSGYNPDPKQKGLSQTLGASS
jgi:hypothetical protein